MKLIFCQKYTILRVQLRKFFLLYLKNSIFYDFFNETSQIFQFFFLTFFQHEEFWINNEKLLDYKKETLN